jgi:elongator complex protein 6
MASRIPPLLEPYLGLPPETSLIALTGVLGASTNWLTQRYLCSFLGTPKRDAGADSGTGQHEGDGNGEMSVVLVSFMRDYVFWKENVGRLGIDLDAHSKRQRFYFVDGLSELFSGAAGGAAQATPGAAAAGRRTLRGATLPDLRKELYQVFAERPGGNVVLILDNPDLLLAASGYTITGEALRETILDIREVCTIQLAVLPANYRGTC